ncbi:MAG: hypothetical protein KAI43_12715 [Candidatus Aureabacteria bacterium]|nr:hypothetical protein [Candidatus Auribacterota bacterium]
MSNRNIDLNILSKEELLKMRICDLPIQIKGTWLQTCVDELYSELEKKGIKYFPPCYLADEWLTPDGEPVVGIAFYLAHLALMKLEKEMMLDCEGGTKEWCMKLLRHEAGHALNYAYKLHKKKKWRKYFGEFSKEYGDTYRFRPYSRNFVRHLEDYYAQYHPDEDFAETFAVWLTPGSCWQEKYKGWKALKKLEFIDELMKEIKNKEPVLKKGKKYWQISSIKKTLQNHYKRKMHFYAEDFPDFHDTNLKKIFSEKTEERSESSNAYTVIKKYRKDILKSVSAWTGEKKYITDDLLKTFTNRCRELKLVIHETETSAVLKISIYLTTLIMNYLYTGRFRGKNEKKVACSSGL